MRSLDASPLIFCAGEIFHGGPNVHHAEYNFSRKLLGSRTLGEIADRCFPRARIGRHLLHYFATAEAGVRAIGFKVMASQLRSYPALMPMLPELEAVNFFLYRRDNFATALSYLRARASGVYHSNRAKAPTEQPVMAADPSEFRALLERCEAAKKDILALHALHGGLLLTYENMIGNWDGFIAAIGAELGIQGLRLDQALDKLSATVSHVRIVNEDDLRRTFAANGSP